MLNQKYLQHDYLTDILTFELAKEPLEAELYISLDRIIDNARAFNKTVADEFHRVAIHGALHLCGYLDATQHQKQKMTKLEDYYLSLPSST
jgi:rRNA maturation RNase YbeY